MSISINDFWKLTVGAGLLSADDARQLHAQFIKLKGSASKANAATLAEWLIAGGILTRYQASVLASGRPGPFVFGDFVILERIERGRLAKCFRAVYQGAQPALLLFAASSADSPEQARATLERVAAARQIKSPHVARVYQYQATARPPFFVLEPLEGQSLRERVAVGRLSLAEACRVGFEAALGLVALHEQGAVHGNMTPDHIWIEPSSTVKLLPYPLAEPPRGDARFDVNVADYLAPELNDPERAPDTLADIYGLGCMLYEWISGRVPFPGGTVAQKRARHEREVPARLDQLVSGVSEELADLVAEMLDKEVMLRAATASHVAHLLSPFTAENTQRRAALPPRSGAPTTAHGYGAWREPGWQAPPLPDDRSAQPAPAEAEKRPTAEAEQPFAFVAAQKSAVAPIGGRKQRKQQATAIVIVASLFAVSLVLALGYLLWGGVEASPQSKSAPPTVAAPAPEAARSENPETANLSTADLRADAATTIEDDGRTLWVSPTSGPPLDVRYLPSSAQLIVALRPAELLASEEGQRVMAALGPEADAARGRLQAAIGVDLADVEQLLIAAAPGEGGRAQTTYVMRLAEPKDKADLLAAWGSPRAAVEQEYLVGAEWAYGLPAEGGGRLAIVAEEEALREILKRDGPPLLRQGIELLLRDSDSARHASVLVAPSFLWMDGREFLPAATSGLRPYWEQLFGQGTQAILASAHLGQELFVELRVVGPSDVRPAQLADQLREQLESYGQQVEQYVASSASAQYGQLVIHRFPRMLQLAGSFTRAGAEDRQAVLRCYLPRVAAHNLALGADLVLRSTTMPASVIGEATTTAPVAAETALDRVTTLAFPRDTLEHSLELLAAEIGVPIVIEGADLQLEGITKNQSFQLDQRDRPARGILGLILRLADADSKLVYVVRTDRDGRESIHITTRTAAARRGEPLGADFNGKSR